MKRFLKRHRKKIILASATIVLGLALPLYAGVVSKFSDTMTSHTTSAISSHTFLFVTPTGVESSTDTILFAFAAGFSLTGVAIPTDVTLAVDNDGVCDGPFAPKTLAATAAAGTWGAAKSGQQVTLTAPTNAAVGEITAGRCAQVVVSNVVNPGTAGSKEMILSGTFGDSGYLAVAITSPGQTAVSISITEGSSGGASIPPGGVGGAPPPDTTPPVITSVRTPTIGPTNATIEWDTNEQANSFVDYGLTTGYEIGTVSNPVYGFLRQIQLTGLQTGTLYHFRARSSDPSGNQATSGDNTFTTVVVPDTTPPVISGINVTNVLATSASLGWTTNENSDSKIEYGPTIAYGQQVTNATAVTTHFLGIAGLTSLTTYHYRVISKDAANNTATSSDGIFTTADGTPPVITGVTVSDLGLNSARVSWTTDEPATTRLEYGFEATYGVVAEDLAPTINHVVDLTGLTEATTYHFQAGSTDAAGNAVSASDQNFTTLADTTPPPNVSNFTATPGDGEVALSWTNPSGIADFVGVRVIRKTGSSPSDQTDGAEVFLGTGTTLTDTRRTNGTRYYYAAFSFDRRNNFSSGALASAVPTAPIVEAPPEVPPEAPPILEAAPEALPEAPPAAPPTPGAPPSLPPPPEITIPVGAVDLNVLQLGQVKFQSFQGRVDLALGALRTLRVLQGTDLTITILDSALSGAAVRQAIFSLGASQYRLEPVASYGATIQLPAQAGDVAASIIITYADGNYDQEDFIVAVQGPGHVYEKINGANQPLVGATVTLYGNGGQTVWPAPSFGQANPVTIGADGAYAYVVPSGSYRMKIEKNEYDDMDTGGFSGAGVLNTDYVLEKLPAPPIAAIEEIFKTPAPVAQKITAITKVIAAEAVLQAKEFAQTLQVVVNNPAIEAQAEAVAAPAVVVIAVANVATVATAATAFNAIAYAQYFFFQPLLLFGRRKRRAWGAVYNSLTKVPVELAVVRLLDKVSGRILQSRVTDRQGRYFFIVGAGVYRLQVIKPGFVFPTVFLKESKEDVAYTEVYHGEDIEVQEEGATVAANIPLDPAGQELAPAKSVLLKAFLRKAQISLGVAGVLASFAVVYIIPSPTTYTLAGVQSVLFAVFRVAAKGKKPKGWGIVYDQMTRKPLHNAVVRIFEPRYNKLLDTFVTDAKGRYSFVVGPSAYFTTYEKSGYDLTKLEPLDYSKQKESVVVNYNVPMSQKTPSATML